MKTSTFLWFSALIAGMFSSLSVLHGQTVAWGSSVSVNPLAFNSTGTVDNNTNIWDLGYFNDGYTPDATNWATWADNWKAVDTNYHKEWDNVYWAVATNNYSVAPAAVGKQMYVFAYNDLAKIGTPQGEALIYRQNGLLFPSSPNQETFDIANNPTDDGKSFNDDNFTVIWGRVDREMYADANGNNGILTGGGIFSFVVPDSNATPYDNGNGTFEAQFATWQVVPEPSAALLSALGMLLLLRRRR